MGLFDRLKANYNKTQKINNFDDNWSRQFIDNNSEKTVIFFCGWRSEKKLHQKVFNQFPDYNHIIYTLPNSLICSDLKLMDKSWRKITEYIEKDIKKFKIEITYGLSLGTSLALYCANRCENVKKIILAFPGDKIAPCLWKGLLTKDIGQRIEQERKYNYEDYKNFFLNYDHINNLSNLKDKKIKICLARFDEVVHYQRGEKLITEMQKRNLDLKITKLPLDHVSGVIYSVVFTNWISK